jgi:hypothetical protein
MNGLKNMQESGKVQEIVEKYLEKTIDSVVEDLFGSWSDFSKDLKKTIQDEIQINLKELKISSYNHMILNAVKEKLDTVISSTGIEKIEQELDQLLNAEQREYKLSELIEMLKKEAMEYEDPEDFAEKEISFHHDSDRKTLHFIYFDSEEDKAHYRCAYRLVIHPETGLVQSIEINERTFDNRLIMGGLRGLDGILFKIYSTGAKIIVDSDYVNTYYPNPYED